MTLDQQILGTLKCDPACFIDLCKQNDRHRWGATYGELDAEMISLRRRGRVRFNQRLGAWEVR